MSRLGTILANTYVRGGSLGMVVGSQRTWRHRLDARRVPCVSPVGLDSPKPGGYPMRTRDLRAIDDPLYRGATP